MVVKMQTATMTEGAPWKHIVKFALPVLVGSLLQQLYNTVDTIVVGRFAGEQALSAVGTTGSFTFLFLALAIGFSAGNGVAVAQRFGAKDEIGVRSNASTGILFLMLLGILTTALGLLVARPAYAYLVNTPTEILEQTILYFRIYALGLVFQFGYNIFSSILRAVGDSAATLYFLLISSVLNIGLDLLFVAAFHWGVAGAAFATVISQAVSFMAAYIYMTRKYPIFKFTLREYRWKRELVRQTVQLGMPICLQLIVVSFGLTFIQRAVNRFGQTMTASFTVGQRIEMYLNLPCNAFQTTLATPCQTGRSTDFGHLIPDDGADIRSGVDLRGANHRTLWVIAGSCGFLFVPHKSGCIDQHYTVPVHSLVWGVSGSGAQRFSDGGGLLRPGYAGPRDLSVSVQRLSWTHRDLVERNFRIRTGLRGLMDVLPDRKLAERTGTNKRISAQKEHIIRRLS